jgi:hypothetical protein
MFCPNCSEKQAIEATQFCSKCGFPTRGVKKLLENDGKIESETELSQRQQGIRQGAKLILLSLILFPAFVLLNSLFPGSDKLIESSPDNTAFEQIGWAVLLTIFALGLARIGYAYLFENHFDVKESEYLDENEKVKNSFQSNETQKALPSAQSIPVSGFGKWKETTKELFKIPRAKEKTSGELK